MAAWGLVFWVDGAFTMVPVWLDDHYTQRVDFGPSAVGWKPVDDGITGWQTEVCFQYSEFLAVSAALILGFRDGEKAGDV
jgi:hypothetical protein